MAENESEGMRWLLTGESDEVERKRIDGWVREDEWGDERENEIALALREGVREVCENKRGWV